MSTAVAVREAPRRAPDLAVIGGRLDGALSDTRELLCQRRIAHFGVNPLLAFDLKYFQDKMRAPRTHRRAGQFCAPAPMHVDLTARLYKLIKFGGPPQRYVAGRGLAKSSYVAEWAPLFAAAEELRMNTVIVGAASQEKEYRTRLQNITRQVETNPRLRRDYPGLYKAMDEKSQGVKWTDDELTFANGCRISCIPAMGNIRGQSYESNRVDFIVLDDILKKKLVKSPTQLRELTEWIWDDVIHSLAPGGIIVWCGTLFAFHDPLVASGLPVEEGGWGWEGVEYPLEDPATGASNFPSLWDEQTIAAERAKNLSPEGKRAFEKERNLRIRVDEDRVYHAADFDRCQFDPARLHLQGSFTLKSEPPLSDEERQTRTRLAYLPWYAKHGLSASTERRIVANGRWEYDGQPLRIVTHCDLAVATNEKACYTAIAVMGLCLLDRPRYLLLEFLKLRLSTPEQLDLIDRVYDFWQQDKAGLEKQSLEMAMHQGLLARRRWPESMFEWIERKNTDDDKLTRIANWVDPVSGGDVLFKLSDNSAVLLHRPASEPELLPQSQRMLRREADEFPLGAFVDGLDATESAYSLLKKLYPYAGAPAGGGSHNVPTPSAARGKW